MTAEFMLLSDEELAGRWRQVGLDVPPGLVEETVRRGERIAIPLGRLLTDAGLWEDSSIEGWAPIHALKLLTAIGGAGRTPFVLQFLREGLGGDWLTEAGADLVCSLGSEAIDELLELVADPAADIYGRSVTVYGLADLGLEHEAVREKICRLFRDEVERLLRKHERNFFDDDAELLDSLVDGLAWLHDEPGKDLIRRAFEEGRCDGGDDELGIVLEHYSESRSRERENPLDFFSPENLDEYEDSDLPPEPDEDDAPAPFVSTAPKVGRNDPCPCGSGKKSKKCCHP